MNNISLPPLFDPNMCIPQLMYGDDIINMGQMSVNSVADEISAGFRHARENAAVYPFSLSRNFDDKEEYEHRCAPTYDGSAYNARGVTHRRVVKKKYSHNGVNVTIEGDEPSVRSIMKILTFYKPKGPINISKTDVMYDDLFANSGTKKKEKDIPQIAVELKNTGDPREKQCTLIYPNNERFTGSGTVIFFVNRKDAKQKIKLDKIFVPLFHNRNTDEYNFSGSDITCDPDTDVDENTLYKNAVRATKKYSADLFDVEDALDDADRKYIDVKKDDMTQYRSYVYFYSIDENPHQIRALYDSNRGSASTFGKAYHDLIGNGDIDLMTMIEYETLKLFIADLRAKNGNLSSESHIFVNNQGVRINISGFAIRILDEMIEKNLEPENLYTNLKHVKNEPKNIDSNIYNVIK